MSKQWHVLPEAPPTFRETFPTLPPVVAAIMYNRGIHTQEEVDEFLYPEYQKHIHDPFLFADMQKAVDRIFLAIKEGQKITIHGDYDADGVSASTVLTDTLTALGAANVGVYLPHRETDGYGLNINTINYLAEQGTSLIITCDCGISNPKEVAHANTLGVDTIITDHHTIPDQLPEALALIHPKLPNETYPCKTLSGGAVAFKLAQGLLAHHKKDHETLTNGETHAGFEKWLLDMVAIANVADMVPLLGETRTLTKFGLLVLNKTRRVGLKKLFIETGIAESDGTLKHDVTEETIGFRLAPQINAAGRLDHANTAYKLMVATSGADGIDLAYALNEQNKERRALTIEYVDEARKQIIGSQEENPILFVYSDRWTTGIIGLIASRLKDEFHKPTIAMAPKQGEITGSGRSIKGFSLIGAMQEIPEHFSKFGGHPMACGFSLANTEGMDALREALCAQYEHNTKDTDMTPLLDIDAEIHLEDITWELHDSLERLTPFGQGNPKPHYVAKGVKVVKVEAMGKDARHLKLQLTHQTPVIRKAIGWSMCEATATTNWCTLLQPGDMIDIVFEVDINEWNGRRELRITIIDIHK
ncbi:MAG: single-stranded-DNA-specific exonuclease RecJ [Candidatus Magasanikbacteria bacterium]|jgi:single-stranded-DNA-specific exonuclease|nr:single-stranded-DNA-specific exonuclease RecJ [Candidatus Magasanikbacteria bacterium]MBT5820510.1 single-stranded-DNA-specific exonuclease RecJ [Candidatus Magasanikbacteria bacterium]